MLPTMLHVGVRAPLTPALPSLKSLHVASPFAPPLPPVAAFRPPAVYHKHGVLPTPPHDAKTDVNDPDASLSRPRSPEVADKRARRKEQCRVNQANYRKRKRQYERQMAGEIVTLEREIEVLTSRRSALAAQRPIAEPEHAIASFYLAMQLPPEPTLAASTSSSLLDLQSQHFASLEELTDNWRQHQRSFGRFQLHALASERLEMGDHAIVKMTAELELSLSVEDWVEKKEKSLVLAVQQCFAIDQMTNCVKHITSDVDIVAGVVAATNHSPQTVALMLEGLEQR